MSWTRSFAEIYYVIDKYSVVRASQGNGVIKPLATPGVPLNGIEGLCKIAPVACCNCLSDPTTWAREVIMNFLSTNIPDGSEN